MDGFVTNGRDVYADPTVPGEGMATAPGMIVPQEKRLSVNGAPIVEDSHVHVVPGPAKGPNHIK
ncbi:MAG TPA: hypothetical protein VN029_01790 [Sphingomonas sp.]|nr:hypothetical protein [Sphingomonas sp.]